MGRGITRRRFMQATGAGAVGIALAPPFAASAGAVPVTRPRADIAFIPGCPELPLHKFHENDIVYPASLTKIMTVMLVLDEVRKGNLKMRDMIDITDEAREATKKGKWNLPFTNVKSMTVEEALTLAMARSYNDVAYSLAQKVSGLKENEEKIRAAGYTPDTEDAFCKVFMQPKAEALGMKNTRFCNSHGLPPHDTNVIVIGDADDYYNISTATDLALLWDHMLTQYPEYRALLSAPIVKAPDGRTDLPNTALQLKNMVTACRSLCSGIKAKDVISKTGTSALGTGVAYSVPRMVPSLGGMVEVAFVTVGYRNGLQRNVAARDMTNTVFKKIRPGDIAERQAIIEAKKIPPPIPSLPVVPTDRLIGLPHIEAVEIEWEPPLLESRPLPERILGVHIPVPEIIR